MMPYADSSPLRETQQHDGALLAASLAGDEGAFSTLYRRHNSTVYRFAYLWSGTAVVAAEVETLIAIGAACSG